MPLQQIRAEDFSTDESYDFVVLCRSPGYTPASADAIFEAIRDEFVEQLLSRVLGFREFAGRMSTEFSLL